MYQTYFECGKDGAAVLDERGGADMLPRGSVPVACRATAESELVYDPAHYPWGGLLRRGVSPGDLIGVTARDAERRLRALQDAEYRPTNPRPGLVWA